MRKIWQKLGFNNEKGSAILLVAAFSSIMMLISFTMANLTITNLRMAGMTSSSLQAFAAAEAGIEKALLKIQTGPDVTTPLIGVGGTNIVNTGAGPSAQNIVDNDINTTVSFVSPNNGVFSLEYGMEYKNVSKVGFLLKDNGATNGGETKLIEIAARTNSSLPYTVLWSGNLNLWPVEKWIWQSFSTFNFTYQLKCSFAYNTSLTLPVIRESEIHLIDALENNASSPFSNNAYYRFATTNGTPIVIESIGTSGQTKRAVKVEVEFVDGLSKIKKWQEIVVQDLQNLLQNPSMSVDSNSDGSADSWQLVNFGPAAGTLSIDSNSQKINATAVEVSGGEHYGVKQYLSGVNIGDIVDASIEWKSSVGSNAYYIVKLYFEGPNSASYIVDTTSSQSNFTKASVSNVVVPAGTTGIYFSAWVQGGGTPGATGNGILWVKNASVYKK